MSGALAWPLSGALVRGIAQAGAKAGLVLWPNPFAAVLRDEPVTPRMASGAAIAVLAIVYLVGA